MKNQNAGNSRRTRLAAAIWGLVWGFSAGWAQAASSIQYEYDTANNVTAKTVDGLRTEYGPYDSKGNPSYVIEAAGTTSARRKDFTYDARFFNKVSTITEPSVHDGSNKVTTYVYDDYTNVLEMRIKGYRPDGTVVSRRWNFEYNGPLRQVTRADGPRSDVSDVFTFDYYANEAAQGFNRGRLREVVGPGGRALRTNIQYTATGKVASETRPNGLTLTYTYYAGNDRLESLTMAAAGESRKVYWTYLATGEVASVTNAHGTVDAATVSFTYDDARRLVRVTDQLGNYVAYTLDTEGNVVGESAHDQTSALYQSISRIFDAYNQLDTKTIAGTTEDFDFNSSGNLVQHVDTLNTVTQYSYDTLRRLTTVTEDALGADTATQSTLTVFGYDVADRVTSVQAGNGALTGYVYDDLGNLLQEQSPDRGTRTYAYDPAGNVMAVTDGRGITAAYAYDAYNRLTALDYPGTAEDVTLTYDTGCANGVGRLCQFTDGSGLTSYTYDALGNIVQQAKSELGVTYTTSYAYNTRGELVSVTTPSGRSIAYGRNARGEVSSVAATVDGVFETIMTDIGYRPDGQLSTRVFGNGYLDTREYNGKGELTSLQMPGGAGDGPAPPNSPPVAMAGTLSTQEDTAGSGTLVASDSDGDSLTYSISTAPALGVVTITNAAAGTYTYTPNADANGSDSFTFVASDGKALSNPATISISIDAINDAPVASDGSLNVTYDSPANGALAATDVDGDALTYQVVTGASLGTVAITEPSTGAYTYTPNDGASGADQFTFQAGDGAATSNVATVSVTIQAPPPNTPPTLAAPGDQTSTEGDSISLALHGQDTDGDTLTYMATGLPASLGIDPATGVISGTVATGAAGSYSVSAGVSDGTDTATTAFVWTVLSAGGAPNPISGTYQMDTLTGTEAADRIEGLEGSDTLYGRGGNDILVGGVGDDRMYGEDGDDTFLVEGDGQGQDRVNGGPGTDTLRGTAGNDVFMLIEFTGDDTVERIDGVGGYDVIAGGNAGNVLDFSSTTLINIAQIEGRDGSDTITGTPNADIIVGGTGSDQLYGGEGDDTFIVDGQGQGYDRVYGEGGNDLIAGGPGDDEIGLIGFEGASTVETIDGGAGTNIIRGSYSRNIYDFSGTTLVNIARIEPSGGHDIITGSSGNDVYVPATGDDLITETGGNDTYILNLGDGADRISDLSGADDRVQFGTGITSNDLVIVQNGDDLIVGFGSGDAATFLNWFAGQRIESFWFDDGSSLTADQIEALLPQALNRQAAPADFMHASLSNAVAPRGEWVVVFATETDASGDAYWVKGRSSGQRWVQRRGPFPATDTLDGLLIVTDEGIHSWKRNPATSAHQYRKLETAWMQRVVLNTSGGSAGLDEVWNYTRDPNGNITAITLPNRSGSYQYDALDRLISEALGTDPAIAYQYDRNGNRTFETVDQTQTTYTYTANTNRLETVGTEGMTHDAAGNRTSDRSGARTFEYNGAGRLYRVYESGTLVATYTYNVLGQRTRKVTSSDTVLYHYDLDGKLLTETDADGNVLREYIHADSIPIAQIDRIGGTDDITYLHTDHLGTPRAGTDANGVLVWRWLGEAFGNSAADEDPDGDGQSTVVNLRYPGQYADGETGFHYNYFRYYDPDTARYVTSDPIGLEGGINTYLYSEASPLNIFDPNGLEGVNPWDHKVHTADTNCSFVARCVDILEGRLEPWSPTPADGPSNPDKTKMILRAIKELRTLALKKGSILAFCGSMNAAQCACKSRSAPWPDIQGIPNPYNCPSPDPDPLTRNENCTSPSGG